MTYLATKHLLGKNHGRRNFGRVGGSLKKVGRELLTLTSTSTYPGGTVVSLPYSVSSHVSFNTVPRYAPPKSTA